MMGSDYPIRVQSMANTSTVDTEASVAQALRIAEAGGEMVRFMAEHRVEKLEEIKAFDRLNYAFSEELSSETEYVFIKSSSK